MVGANNRRGAVQSRPPNDVLHADHPESCCGRTRVHGVPCRHFCAFSRRLYINPVTLVDDGLTTTTQKAVYQQCMPARPIGTPNAVEELWSPNERNKGLGHRRSQEISDMWRCGERGHNKLKSLSSQQPNASVTFENKVGFFLRGTVPNKFPIGGHPEQFCPHRFIPKP